MEQQANQLKVQIIQAIYLRSFPHFSQRLNALSKQLYSLTGEIASTTNGHLSFVKAGA